MSAHQQQWDLDATGLHIAVVVARFNSNVTYKLKDGALEALATAKAKKIEVFEVPGAYELPLAAKVLAKTGDWDAIVALGTVIRGDTPHFDFVAGECTRGLQQVMLDTMVPVAFGVLTTDNLEQAEERAGGVHGNKGFDAAMTAIEMVRFAQSAGKS